MVNKKKILLFDLLNKCKISYNKISTKNLIIKSAEEISSSNKDFITVFNSIKYLDFLKKTKACTVLINNNLLKYLPKKKNYVLSKNPQLDFAKILNFFNPNSYYSKIDYNSLQESEIRKKYKEVKFGFNIYLENDVKIGRNVCIGNNVTIKKGCVIGNNVNIGSNVIIESSIICDDVHICDNSVIGKKGFGFKFENNTCIRIPHIGKVIINRGCEIGSNCVIDRGSIGNTVLGENTFVDNLVQIAHNVVIGKKCILASQVGIAGSTHIGNNVIIGGQAGISGHLKIGNNVKIGGKSGVINNIEDDKVVMGYPAKSFRDFLKNNK
jgi:UDP-3-O-[3-hydroxymyristoyl] glucosamine N-acyltransferase